MRRFDAEILDKTINQFIYLREKIARKNNEISQIDIEIADLCYKNNMYSEFHIQGIVDEVSYIERTSELKSRIKELRDKRIKLLYESDEEHYIENLRILKETLEESPKVILAFDNLLFCSIVDKITVGKNKVLTFRLKGGLSLEIKIWE